MAGDDWGTVVFEITSSSLENVCFNIYAGGSKSSPSDVVTATGGPLCSQKAPGNGQSFILAGRN